MKSKLTKHFFSVKIAEKYDMECAVILENLLYWIEKNRANEKNKHEGLYWTYNSISAFHDLFPYLTKHKIRRALDELEKDGVITTGNFNKIAYDRTKWYAITEYGYSIFENLSIHLPKTANGVGKSGKPIPNSKPNKKPNSKPDKEACEKSENFSPFHKEVINKFWNYLEDYHPHSYKQYKKKKTHVENKWVNTINWLMDNTVDTYTKEEIYNAIKSAIDDDFWCKQFRTLNKLKKTDKDGTRYIAKFLDLIEQNKSEVDKYLEGI